MKRLKLLLGMLVMGALLLSTVLFASPYAPVVAPVMEIEEIWAIEDTRVESSTPLVTALENHGVPLAYEKNENTFYCTLGLGHAESWPDIHLTAPESKNVKLVFVDDYTYDWCADAIHDGYPYQILAYTDEAFWYFDVVFTGMPLVAIECGEEITRLDTPAQVTVSWFGEKKLETPANIHLRGGTTLEQEKKNLRVEFTRAVNGKKHIVELPGFGPRENILLNPMVFDHTMLRDRISWALYGDMLGEGYSGAFGERKMAYAEVFLNNEYQGVYLMMEPYDPQEELSREGGKNPLTDSVYRSIKIFFEDDRPVIANPTDEYSRYELRYEPAGTKQFAPLGAYLDMLAEPDDEEFARKAACMDMESVVRYMMLRQVAGLSDNVNNNLYLWARQSHGGMTYTMVPWDMDLSWGKKPENLGAYFECWLAFPMLDRMLVCNAQGIVDLLIERWHQWRQGIFTPEHVQGILEQYVAELTESGALPRNAAKWDVSVNDMAVDELVWFFQSRLTALDKAIEMFEDDSMAYPPFLSDIDSDLSSYRIYDPEM